MKRKAFSLIELSVIFIVIGLLSVAITKGGALLHSARISSAKSTTSSAKIAEIEGLSVWFDTVSDGAIDESSKIDNKPVSYWQDISSPYNIRESINRVYHLDSKIVYHRDGISNLPSLQFKSSGYFVSPLNGGERWVSGKSDRATVFMVFSPTLPVSSKMTILDSRAVLNNTLSINSTQFEIESNNNVNLSYNFNEGESYIVGVSLSSKARLFVNNVDESDSSNNLDFSGFDGLTIGTDLGGADNFTGLISEIIIFDRVLKVEERRSVMSYLSKKYSIRVEGAL